MTLQELLEKNAKARARRNLVAEKAMEEQPSEEVKVVESEKVEEEIITKEKEVSKKTSSSPKKQSAKPKNRAYMVVEDIEKVNDTEDNK